MIAMESHCDLKTTTQKNTAFLEILILKQNSDFPAQPQQRKGIFLISEKIDKAIMWLGGTIGSSLEIINQHL